MDLINIIEAYVGDEQLSVEHLEVVWLEKSLKERRQLIENAQEIVQSLEVDAPADIPIKHHFGAGTYGRECTIPAGVVCVGKLYIEGQVNVMTRGRLLLITENSFEIVEGTHVGISTPNTKKFGYILEDTHWVTVMARDLDETDPDTILNSHTFDNHGEVGYDGNDNSGCDRRSWKCGESGEK